MLPAAQDVHILTDFPWMLAPAAFLLLALLGFNFLAERIRRVFSMRSALWEFKI
jgi:ABC-type dipeptide/oligopeptide/nickel transport system permease subunit